MLESSNWAAVRKSQQQPYKHLTTDADLRFLREVLLWELCKFHLYAHRQTVQTVFLHHIFLCRQLFHEQEYRTVKISEIE